MLQQPYLLKEYFAVGFANRYPLFANKYFISLYGINVVYIYNVGVMYPNKGIFRQLFHNAFKIRKGKDTLSV